MTGYIDIHEIHPDFEEHICPNCGTQEYFQRYGDGQPHCLACRNRLYHDLEKPCPNCSIRMVIDEGSWHCRHCGERRQLNGERLRDRLTGRHEVTGYCRMDMLTCPLCGEVSMLCDPDGTLVCDECEELYVGRFSDAWYAYAIWMRNPGAIRVRTID